VTNTPATRPPGGKPLFPTPRFTGFMQSRLIIALLTAGGIAFACGPRPSESEAASAPSAPDRRSAIVNAPALATTLELSVSDGVDLRLHVTNASGKKIEMTFPTGQTHDFYILDASGREVWRWSEGRMFTQGVQKKLVDAGATVSFADRWAGPVAGGTYTAVAVLMSTSHRTEQRVEFTRE
jgi:hypothetical protein